ncbi:AI-2E family transporter, partial [Bacillus vallismortis]|nr:AI-2E family transporter [Bacillus vallismortis]
PLTNDLSHSQWFPWLMNQDDESISKIEQSLTSFLQNLPNNITSSLSAVFGVVTNITLVIIYVPFILFFMMKDGHRFPN